MAVRGCGASRIEGGIYFVTKLSRKGRPVEYFLIDPPIPVPEAFDLPNRGIAIRERRDGSGIHDVYDHIGSKHYPNVWDFVAEVKKLGLSRHVSKNIDFSLLSNESLIILAHSRAVIDNAHDFYGAIVKEMGEYDEAMQERMRFSCPKHNTEHEDIVRKALVGRGIELSAPTCAGLWLHDIHGGETMFDPEFPPRSVERTVGESIYFGRKTPEKLKLSYQRGFFLALPLSGIEVVKAKDFSHEGNVGKARQSGLNVEEVDE